MPYAVIHKNNKKIFDNTKDFFNYIYTIENGNKILKKNISFKKFKYKKEAIEWLNQNEIKKISKLDNKTLFFDSGTGRGITEARVTGPKGKSLIKYAKLKNIKINKYGNVEFPEKTNNYGELAALFIALTIALKYKYKKIAGDSKLAIKWWSNGIYKEQLPESTIKLIKKTQQLKQKFEIAGGTVYYVPGDYNPADLGFHKSFKKKK